MDTNMNNVIEINLKDLFFYLLKKSWIMILAGIIFAAGARYYTIHYVTPVYTSSAKLYITSNKDGKVTTLTDLQIGTYLTKDYAILVKSRPVSEEVIKKLNLKISSGFLSSLITVNTSDESRVLQISVSYFDRDMVKKLVDTIAEVSSERMESIMGEQVNVLEGGYQPYWPSAPNVRKNTLLAGCFGILAAAVLFVILFLFNDSIRTAEDIEKYLGLTTLGSIPVEVTVKKKKQDKGKKKKAA